MLLWHSLIGPPQQLLIINYSHSLNPIKFTDLPHQPQHQSRLSINNINTSNSNKFSLKFILTYINYIVTILNYMNSTIQFARVFLPIHQIRSKPINYLQQNCTVSQVVDKVVYINFLNSLRVNPIFKYSNFSALICLRLRWQFHYLLMLNN